MTEAEQPALHLRLWKRLWPASVLVLVTFGTLTLYGYIVAGIIFHGYPSKAHWYQLFAYAMCWILSLVSAGWILFRRKMNEGDVSPFFAAFGAAIIVALGVATEVFIIFLIQTAHRP